MTLGNKMAKKKESGAVKLQKKVYKQMKAGEKSDEKVHKDIKKMLKHEKEEERAGGIKGDKKLHEMAEKRREKKDAPKKSAAKKKISKVMVEFEEKKLHSGSLKGPKVTNPKQAIAIALSESKKVGKKKK